MKDNNNIPKNWQRKKLGEVCQIIMGQSPPSTTYNTKGIGLPFFQGKAEFTELYPVVEKWCNAPNKIAEPNDILLSVRAPVGTTNIANIKCCIGRGLAAIRYDNFKYVYYFLKSIEQELDSKGTGTTFRAISGETIRMTEMPVPPTAEQQAIVAKIEELLSELENGKQQLLTAQQQLKVYRQSLLKAAFEGKLTNKNVKEGELPKGWIEKKIKDVCHNIKVGIVIKPSNYYAENGIGIKAFRSANVREFKINDSEWVYFSESANEINYRTKLKYGDVLLVRSGYPGTSCIVSKEFEGCNAIDILIATPNNEKILPEYLCYFNNSPLGKGLFISKSRGVAQKHLNVGEYSNLKIHIPKLKEQLQIIQELDNRLLICARIEETIRHSLQQADVLRQSILKKAFEGKLKLN